MACRRRNNQRYMSCTRDVSSWQADSGPATGSSGKGFLLHTAGLAEDTLLAAHLTDEPVSYLRQLSADLVHQGLEDLRGTQDCAACEEVVTTAALDGPS
eukprot:4640633-Pyramimonas_sp.AAC.1